MKKFLLCAISAVAMLFCASCSNEDIEIGTEVSIKVAPEKIIEGLVEFNTGDFNNVGIYTLRVRTLIYNESGALINQQTLYTDSYSKVLNFTPKLSEGTYTVICVADLVELDKNNKIKLAFWNLEDSTELRKVKVVDAGYVGNQRKIVGAANQKLTVSPSGASITIRPEIQGCIIVNMFYDYSGMYKKNKKSEVANFRLLTKKSTEHFAPSDKGFEFNFKTDQWYRLGYLNSTTYSGTYTELDGSQVAFEYGYAQGYSFTFPTNNALYSLGIQKTNETNSTTWSGKTINFVKGKQYVFEAVYYGDIYGDDLVYADYDLVTIEQYLSQGAPLRKHLIENDEMFQQATKLSTNEQMENNVLKLADI